MKNKFIKMMTAGVLAAMLTVSSVMAAPSIGAAVTVVEGTITEVSGVTDAEGNPVLAGTIEVIPIKDEETEVTEIITPVSEEVKIKIEEINEIIEKAAKTEKFDEFTKAMKEIVEEKLFEYADKNDSFDVETCLPLTKIHDVVVRDAAGNIVEGARNLDIKIEVQNLTKALKDIRILHYNIDKEKWIVIEPEVDYEAKTLTFHLDVVGPIMVVYNPENVEEQ